MTSPALWIITVILAAYSCLAQQANSNLPVHVASAVYSWDEQRDMSYSICYSSAEGHSKSLSSFPCPCRVIGGWTRMAYLNMSDPNQLVPPTGSFAQLQSEAVGGKVRPLINLLPGKRTDILQSVWKNRGLLERVNWRLLQFYSRIQWHRQCVCGWTVAYIRISWFTAAHLDICSSCIWTRPKICIRVELPDAILFWH